MKQFSYLRAALSVLVALVVAGVGDAARREAAAGDAAAPPETPFATREFPVESDHGWIGNAVCYGPHRDGQYPGGPAPTRDQLAEDLDILARHWNLLRVYGTAEPTGTLLDLIRERGDAMKVLLGVWIQPELDDAARAANEREIARAVRFAGMYPGIVTGISVGNETQVFWSDHRVPADVLVRYLRRARAETTVPVTAADDFNFWNKPESDAIAAEVDFVLLHAHPLWNGVQLEDAVDWTAAIVDSIRRAHPDRTVVLGETGWATERADTGDQGKLMKGRLGEAEQAVFYRAIRTWAEATRTPAFFFEAFDENWKGGNDPREVEKHWGLYRADRTPKAAMAGEK